MKVFFRGSYLKDHSCDGLLMECVGALNYLCNINFSDMRFNNYIKFEASDPRCPTVFPKAWGSCLDRRKPSDHQIIVQPTCFLKYYNPDVNTVCYTMWDSTELPQEYVDEVNKCRLCLVPSEANRRVFINSGVTTEVRVLHHGIHGHYYLRDGDSNRIWAYKGLKRSKSDIFTIGSAGQMVKPVGDKKNLLKIVDAFKKAFNNNTEMVRLSLKINQGAPIPSDLGDNRIEIIDKNMSLYELSGWYKKNSVYINGSKYEAFGRHMAESLASGVPIITPKFAGINDYFRNWMGYELGYEVVETGDNTFKTGYWADPTEESMINQMRNAYSDYQNTYEWKLRGFKISKAMKSYNTMVWNMEFCKIIKETFNL